MGGGLETKAHTCVARWSSRVVPSGKAANHSATSGAIMRGVVARLGESPDLDTLKGVQAVCFRDKERKGFTRRGLRHSPSVTCVDYLKRVHGFIHFLFIGGLC